MRGYEICGLSEIEAFKARMGWRIPWVSSFGSDFNYDYQVSFTKEEIAKGKAYHNYKMQEIKIEEMSGISVFYKNVAGDVFHTYSTCGRGAEELVTACVCLDLTPKGRNETGPGLASATGCGIMTGTTTTISISLNRTSWPKLRTAVSSAALLEGLELLSRVGSTRIVQHPLCRSFPILILKPALDVSGSTTRPSKIA